MPTRLPYGLSYIKPGSASDAYTFLAGDTTPDVSLGTVWFTRTTSALTITNFDGGEIGKIIYVACGSASVTTLQNSGGGIVFSSSATNLVMGANQVIQFLNDGTQWLEITPRN